MLADMVEASSRTLIEPTPSRIKAHVHSIIRNVLAEGQLDAAELTFKDLDHVSESFILILTGIFHKRIEYPDKLAPKPGLEDAGEDVPALQYKPGAENYHGAQWVEAKSESGRGRAFRKAVPDTKKKAVFTQGLRQRTSKAIKRRRGVLPGYRKPEILPEEK
jgi:hypothetical protein